MNQVSEENLLERYEETCIEVTEAHQDEEGFWWGYLKRNLVELFYISDDETRAEAYAKGLRPTNVIDSNGNILHIEVEA